MRLISFTKGTEEYVIFTHETDPAEDFAVPGFKVVVDCEVEFFRFKSGLQSELPVERNLVAES